MYGIIPRTISVMTSISFLALLACGEGPEPKSEPEAPSHTVSEHMEVHFSQVKDIQKAAIRGDLEGLKEPSKWMVEHEIAEGLPTGWEPYVAQMQRAAQVVGEATDLDAAAAATAQMARTCGACHEAFGVTPPLAAASPPPEDTGTVPHMIGHMWAADRMWEGIIIPSTESWTNGVEVLKGAPLHPEVLSENAQNAAELDALAKQVHEMAAAGVDTETLDERAELYGRFLGTCAQCHQMLGKGGPQ